MGNHIISFLDICAMHGQSVLAKAPSIPDMIKVLKGNSARAIFIANPDLKKQLWGGHLWNPSYFVATVSDNTRKQVQEYIASQKTRN